MTVDGPPRTPSWDQVNLASRVTISESVTATPDGTICPSSSTPRSSERKEPWDLQAPQDPLENPELIPRFLDLLDLPESLATKAHLDRLWMQL